MKSLLDWFNKQVRLEKKVSSNGLFVLLILLCACHTEPPVKEKTPEFKPQIKYVDNIPVELFSLVEAPFTYDSGEQFIVMNLTDLTTDGVQLLGWSNADGLFLVDGDGIGKPIGSFGQGPGQYDFIATGSVGPTGIHILDRKNRVTRFIDGKYDFSFRIQGPPRITMPMLTGSGSDETLVTEDFIITQTTMNGVVGEIATIYSHEGEPIGTVVDPEFDREKLITSSWSQRTHWAMQGDRMFVLYMYWGWLLELDLSFNIIKRHQLESAITNKYLNEYLLADISDKGSGQKNIPMFLDFQIYEGMGYAIAHATLHQFDLDTGKVTRIYRMRVPDHPILGERPYTAMLCFAILHSGKIVMAHPSYETLFIADFPPTPHTPL